MKPKFAFVSYRISRRLAVPGILPVAVALSLAAPQARAASGTWNVDTASSWATPANWTGSTVAGGTIGDVGTFSNAITAARTVTLDGNRLLGVLNVSPPGTFAFTLAGNNTGGFLVLNNGGSGAQVNFLGASTAANTIYAPIILQDNLEISSTSTVNQALRGSIAGAFGVTIDSNGAHPAGTTSTVGDVILSGVNTFSGGLTVTEARLQASNASAMGTGTVTVNDGGGVYLGTGGFIDNNFTLRGYGWNESTGRLGALRIDANAVINGNINFDNAGGTVPAARVHAHTGGNVAIRFDGVLSGNANVEFTKGAANGSATWILNNTNTYAGTTTIGLNAGGTGTSILQLGNDNTSGSLNAASAINIGTGGVLAFNRRDNVTLANTITGAGGVTHSGRANVTLDGVNLGFTGTATANGPGWLGGSVLTIGTGGALTYGGSAIAMSNYADVEFNTSSNVTLSGVVSGGRGTYLVQNGTGILTLGGTADNAAARAMVNSGTLVLGKASTAAIHAIGGGGDIGLVINGGTAQLGGTGNDQIVDNGMVRLNGGTFDLNGTAEVIGTLSGGAGGVVTNSNAVAGGLTVNGTANTMGLFYNGTNGSSEAYAPVFGGVIQDGAGAVGLTKAGSGLQILTGNHTFTGATTISGGNLAITGSLAAVGTVDVNGGSLAGTGSVGAVTMAVTAGSTLRPGATGNDNDAAGATLRMASLTVNGGDLRLNIGTTNDKVAVIGTANLAAASTVTPLFSAPPVVGNYTILTSGTLTPTALPTLAGIPATTRSTFAVAQNLNNLELQVTGASAKALTWSGGTGAWDLNTTANFGADTFFNLDSVTFADASVGDVTVTGTLTPSAILDTTTGTNNVSLIGTGIIAGAGGITKTGSSTLTVSTPNTFSGDVTLTSGTLKTGNAAALGSVVGQTFISGGGTLDVNGQNLGAEIVTIAGTGVGGNGALINTGAGSQNALRFLSLSADASVGGTSRFDIRTNGGGEILDLRGNTLTKTGTGEFHIVGTQVTSGNLVATQGILAIETTSIVQGTGTITYNAGTTAAFYQNPNGNVTRPMVMNDSIVENYGQNNVINSNITASGIVTLQGNGGTHQFLGDWTESAPNSGIVKNGTSTYVLGGDVAYTGTTTVNNGTLRIGNAGYTALPATSGIILNGGALNLNINGSQTLSAPITFNQTSVTTAGYGALVWQGVEQDSALTMAAPVGSSTMYGALTVSSGVVNIDASSPLNVLAVSVNNSGTNSGGANMGTLNITSGSHRVGRLYAGDGTNLSGIVNMSGGTLTIDTNGATALAATNNSGYAIGGGFRIGHFNNTNSNGSVFNLSGGTLDASLNTVAVGWDGAGFLNITGGTLKAYAIYVDGSGSSALGIINRMDVSGGANLELGFGGIQSGGNSAINAGDSTWTAVDAGNWTRGISLNATGASSTTIATGVNRVNLSGALAGDGNLTKTGSGVLQLGGANVNTGAIVITSGMLRMGNAQALGDGTVAMAAGTTLDINGQGGAGAGFRPSSVTLAGGTGLPGSLGAIINSSGTTGGFGVDPGGTITLSSDTTVFAVGRLELGTGSAGNQPTINAGSSTLTKNGHGQLIWRGNSSSSVGDIIVNGGHFYAEEQDNSLGSGGSITVNRGAALSAWQSDGTTTQNKPIVLNGGALMADVTSNWTGGLTLTADSLVTRNGSNAGVLVVDNATLDLNGFTLKFRDRATTTLQSNALGSGGGLIDIAAGQVNIGASSLIDSAVKVRTDGNLVFTDATGALSGALELAGGKVSENAANARAFAGPVSVSSYGYLGSLNAGGSFTTGVIALAPNAGLTFGSGTGYTDAVTAGTAMGAVSPAGITGGLATFNPNLTVSSNLNAATGNDTVFATWDGTKYTGLAPTKATIAGAGAADHVLVTAAEAVAASQSINTLVTEQTVTVNAGAVLKIDGGGIIFREATTAGIIGAGTVTSGRSDGMLSVTGANHFDTAAGDYELNAVIADNVLPSGAFTPVTLVVNGAGNVTTGNSTFSGGLLANSGRVRLNAVNGLGLGSGTVRDGGTIMAISDTTAFGFHNNLSLAGLGMNEGGGTFGALRLSGANATGTLALAPGTRIHTNGGQSGAILGNITGGGGLEKSGGGTLSVYSAVDFSGALTLGVAGPGTPNGTYNAFTLADGGVASSIGTSSSAAANLVIQSGTLGYLGGGASTDRLFTLAPSFTTGAAGGGIANNGYGNLNFTNPGAIAMATGPTDVTFTLTANNFTANTFTPTLADPVGARLNLTVGGSTGTWTLNGSSYQISGTVNVNSGADLILDTPGDMVIPLFTASGGGVSYIIKNNTNTVTFGGSSLLAEADNSSGALIMNAGTVIFDKRGTDARVLGSSGDTGGFGLQVNGGLIQYASTASPDQIYNNVDVRMTGGTIDLNGKWDEVDALAGTGGTITNNAAGTLSRFQVGSNNSRMPWNFEARYEFGGSLADGAGTLELVKAGSGVFVLSGDNSAWSGRTYVYGSGLLSIDSEERLGANPASFVANQLQLVGTSGIESTATFAIDDSNRGIWLVNDVAQFRPASGTTLTLATTLAGIGGVEVVGGGGLTLAGANTYSGATSIYRGTLTLDYTSQDNSKLSDAGTLFLRGGNLVLNGGTHSEFVGSTTIDGATGGNTNAGSTNISRTSGSAVLNLNGITRTMGGSIDIGAAGIVTTDTGNSNGILASANGAYATLGKTDWAVSTGTADSPIGAFSAYAVNNYGAAANHVDVTADSAFAAATTVSTLRFNSGTVNLGLDGQTLALNQQGILVTSGSTGATISGGTVASAALGAAGTTDIIIHQHSASPLTISSVIAPNTNNTTGLTKAGAGTLVLSAANTYTGVTHLNEGTLELQGVGTIGSGAGAIWIDGTLKLNRSGNYTIGNGIGGNAGGLIHKLGTGITTLSGGIGSYAGGALVSQGTLVVSGDAFGNPNALNDQRATGTVYGTITLGDGNTESADDVIFLGGRGASHTMRKNIVVANTGSSGVAVIGTGTGTAAIGNFNLIHEGNVEMNRPTILRGDTADRLTFRGMLSGNVGTLTIDAPNITGVVINTNPGRTSFENDNTFVGNVVINGAILQIGSGSIADPRDQIPDASNVTLIGVSSAKQAGLTLNGDGETINNLNGDANTFIQSAASSSATQMRLTVNGTGTFQGVYNGGNNTGMTLEKAGSGTFTLGGTADNPTGRVLVSGGMLVLAKTSSGSVHAAATDVTITGGTLQLGGTGGDQIYDNTPVTMFGGTFDMGGQNEAFQSLTGDVGTVTNSTGTSTLTLGANNGSGRFGGTIQDGAGTLALAKTGNGGAVLTGTNTYSGTTTINAGYIQIGDGHTSGTLGAGDVTVAAGADLVVNRSDSLTIPNTITGPGNLLQNGQGMTILAGNSSYTGQSVVSAGSLFVNGSLGNTATTVAAGATLGGTGTVGGPVNVSGTLTPGASIESLGTGALTMNSGSTFVFEATGNGAAGADLVTVNGPLSLTNVTLNLAGADLSLPTWLVGDKLTLISYTGADATGGFTGYADDTSYFFGANEWLFDYNDAVKGNNFAPEATGTSFVTMTLVPEPSTALLGGFGLLALLRRRRKS